MKPDHYRFRWSHPLKLFHLGTRTRDGHPFSNLEADGWTCEDLEDTSEWDSEAECN